MAIPYATNPDRTKSCWEETITFQQDSSIKNLYAYFDKSHPFYYLTLNKVKQSKTTLHFVTDAWQCRVIFSNNKKTNNNIISIYQHIINFNYI